MDNFRKKFIEEIISADESNIEGVINSRISQLTEKNVNENLLHLFLASMIYVFTQIVEEESLNPGIRKNITHAIKTFKRIQYELTSKKGSKLSALES